MYITYILYHTSYIEISNIEKINLFGLALLEQRNNIVVDIAFLESSIDNANTLVFWQINAICKSHRRTAGLLSQKQSRSDETLPLVLISLLRNARVSTSGKNTCHTLYGAYIINGHTSVPSRFIRTQFYSNMRRGPLSLLAYAGNRRCENN